MCHPGRRVLPPKQVLPFRPTPGPDEPLPPLRRLTCGGRIGWPFHSQAAGRLSVLSLIALDLRRLLVRRRFRLVTLGIAGAGIVWMASRYAGTSHGIPHNACHATVESVAFPFMFTLPLLVGLVAADLLALDRSTGYIATVLPRCRGRWRYVVSKMVAAACAAAIAVTAVYLLVFAAAAVRFPLFPPAEGNVSLFAADLFFRQPVGYLLLRWGLHVAAGAVLAWFGLLASLWMKSPYTASGVPLVACLLLTYPCFALELPAETVMIMMITLSRHISLTSVCLYWGGLGLAVAALTGVVFVRKDFCD